MVDPDQPAHPIEPRGLSPITELTTPRSTTEITLSDDELDAHPGYTSERENDSEDGSVYSLESAAMTTPRPPAIGLPALGSPLLQGAESPLPDSRLTPDHLPTYGRPTPYFGQSRSAASSPIRRTPFPSASPPVPGGLPPPPRPHSGPMNNRWSPPSSPITIRKSSLEAHRPSDALTESNDLASIADQQGVLQDDSSSITSAGIAGVGAGTNLPGAHPSPIIKAEASPILKAGSSPAGSGETVKPTEPVVPSPELLPRSANDSRSAERPASVPSSPLSSHHPHIGTTSVRRPNVLRKRASSNSPGTGDGVIDRRVVPSRSEKRGRQSKPRPQTIVGVVTLDSLDGEAVLPVGAKPYQEKVSIEGLGSSTSLPSVAVTHAHTSPARSGPRKSLVSSIFALFGPHSTDPHNRRPRPSARSAADADDSEDDWTDLLSPPPAVPVKRYSGTFGISEDDSVVGDYRRRTISGPPMSFTSVATMDESATGTVTAVGDPRILFVQNAPERLSDGTGKTIEVLVSLATLTNSAEVHEDLDRPTPQASNPSPDYPNVDPTSSRSVSPPKNERLSSSPDIAEVGYDASQIRPASREGPTFNIPPPPSISPASQLLLQSQGGEPDAEHGRESVNTPSRDSMRPGMRDQTTHGPSSGDEPPNNRTDLALNIASHILSTHASNLMQHASKIGEVSETMYRMAEESLDLRNVLLRMSQNPSGTTRHGEGPSDFHWRMMQGPRSMSPHFQPEEARGQPMQRQDIPPVPQIPPRFKPPKSADPVQQAWLGLHGIPVTGDMPLQGSRDPYDSRYPAFPFTIPLPVGTPTHSFDQQAVGSSRVVPPTLPLNDAASSSIPLPPSSSFEAGPLPSMAQTPLDAARDAQMPMHLYELPALRPNAALEWVREADRLGVQGWDHLHRAEEAWRIAISLLKHAVENNEEAPPQEFGMSNMNGPSTTANDNLQQSPLTDLPMSVGNATSPDQASRGSTPSDNALGGADMTQPDVVAIPATRPSSGYSFQRSSYLPQMEEMMQRSTQDETAPDISDHPFGLGDLDKARRVLGLNPGDEIPIELHRNGSPGAERLQGKAEPFWPTTSTMTHGSNKENVPPIILTSPASQTRTATLQSTHTLDRSIRPKHSSVGRKLKKRASGNNLNPKRSVIGSSGPQGVRSTTPRGSPPPRLLSGFAIPTQHPGGPASREVGAVAPKRVEKKRHWWSRKRK